MGLPRCERLNQSKVKSFDCEGREPRGALTVLAPVRSFKVGTRPPLKQKILKNGAAAMRQPLQLFCEAL